MDLDFTPEQEMLRKSISELLNKECPYDRVKEIEESDIGYAPDIWKKMAKLGWLEINIPEAYGGLGDPFINTAIIMEEIGKKAFPSPYFSTAVWGSLILAEGASHTQKKALFPEIAKGKLILALAQLEEDGGLEAEAINMQAEISGDRFLLSGTKLFVLDANIADKMIVVSRVPDKGITLFLVDAKTPDITCRKMPSIGMDNNCEVTFNQVSVNQSDIIGDIGKGWDILETVSQKATVAKCAEMLGGCLASIQMTAAYAKQRIQYDTPIGGFQVIQHYMADMKIGYDLCINFLNKVVWMIDEEMDVHKERSVLKAQISDHYKSITEKAVQIHGGVGTTREFNIGLYYRRAKAFDYFLGDSDYHYNKLASALSLQ